MIGSRSRTLLATCTTFEPAWRFTATISGRGRLAVPAHPELHPDALVLHGVFDVGDIAQIDGSGAGAADDQIPVRRGVFQLPLRLKQSRAGRAVELPRPGVAGPVLHGVGEVVDRNSARPHFRGIDLDADGGLRAKHVHAAHAGQDADPLADLRAPVVVELAARDRVARQSDVQNRLVVRIGFRVGRRRRQIRGQAAGGLRNSGLHIRRGRVDALVQRELQREAHVALRALRGHQFEPVDLHELPFERRGDVVGDGVGARSGIIRLHRNHRVVHHRQIVDREAQITQHAENDDGNRQDRGHDRAANEWF